MGEYADMMLDGTCCAGCGEYLFNDDPWGIPTFCASCQRDSGGHGHLTEGVPCPVCSRYFGSGHAMRQHRAAKHPEKKHACPDCNKKFATEAALGDHAKMKHGIGAAS